MPKKGNMTAYFAAVAGMFGLLIGSFLNVVAYRVPLGRSVVAPPSACPACGHQIRRRDNIPVASWLLLRGKCRDCGSEISARYPIVEAATGILFAGTYLVIGATWVLPAYLFFVATTVALVLTDLDHKRIPNRILYPATVIALVLLVPGAAADGTLSDVPRALGGGGIYFGILLVIALVARGGFGMGDVKLAFLLGVFLAFAVLGHPGSRDLPGLPHRGGRIAAPPDNQTEGPEGCDTVWSAPHRRGLDRRGLGSAARGLVSGVATSKNRARLVLATALTHCYALVITLL